MLKVELKEFNSIIGTIEGLYHEAAVKLGLPDSEFNILYMIYDQGSGCKQSTICRMTGLTRSTLNSALQRMEKSGLLYLKQGQGRNTLIYMTDKGNELMHKSIERVVAAENRIYLSWSKDDQEKFVSLNRRFAEQFKEELKDM